MLVRMVLVGSSPDWEVRKWIPRKWDGKVPKSEEYRTEGDFCSNKFSGWALYN